MSQINGFKGFIGYSIRELDSNETDLYCSSSQANEIPKSQNQVNFTSDFMLRTYSSGCYFYDTNTGKWSSNGMDIYEDSTMQQTHW